MLGGELMAMANRILLKVENLSTYFELKKPHPFARAPVVKAVDGVSFEIGQGKTFGLVGESGCGKSTLGLSVLRLIEPTSGRIQFSGIDLLSLGHEACRRMRRRMNIIFQDPYSSLNPYATAGQIITAPLKVQKIGTPQDQARRLRELLNLVGLQPQHHSLYPHQFSGGQRQRICIARALASMPDFVVCDEPVSSLDVAIRAGILNLLLRLQQRFGLSYLFISHDMAVVQHFCDEIGVMYLGKIIERTDRRSLFKQPLHPYTQALLSVVPTVERSFKSLSGRIRLIGDLPSPVDPPSGCRFHTRCAYAEKRCVAEMPTLVEVDSNHYVACHRVAWQG